MITYEHTYTEGFKAGYDKALKDMDRPKDPPPALNMAALKMFDQGVRMAASTLRDKLYYVPDRWKVGEALMIYNIVINTLNDLELNLERSDK